MPGRKRMYLAGLPYHIVQRGNNREVIEILGRRGKAGMIPA